MVAASDNHMTIDARETDRQSAPREWSVSVNGHSCRVWEKGSGAPVGFLAGPPGLLRWTPFLDLLAPGRRVVAPSLPGFPGATGHLDLDHHLDWLLATRDLLEAAGLLDSDLIGVSFGAEVLADLAAVWSGTAQRLVLVSPMGRFDPADPAVDFWAQPPGALSQLLSTRPDRYEALTAVPVGVDPLDWQILLDRAEEAAVRFLYPFGDSGLSKRLHRIRAPTLVVRGGRDRILPAAYPQAVADAVPGASEVVTIDDAGYLVDLDEPEKLASTVLRFLDRGPVDQG